MKREQKLAYVTSEEGKSDSLSLTIIDLYDYSNCMVNYQ